jgi:hypothetical protein
MVADARPGALSRRPAPSLLISASRAGSPRPLDGRRCKDGAAQAPPRTALLIRGSKPDPRRVRTGAPDHRVRDDEGTRIRAVPRARQLEGAPHVVFESQRGQLAGHFNGRVSGPRSLPLSNGAWASTRITRQQLNEESAIRDPLDGGCGNLTLRPAKGRRGRVKKQVVNPYPIALNGPRLGGLTHGYTFWNAPTGDSASSVCVTDAG